MLNLVRTLKAVGVRVSVVPRLLEVVGSSVEFDDVHGVTVMGVRRFDLTRSSAAFKRAFDLVGASLGLLAISPLLIAIAIAIKIGSRGPVLYRSMRPGIGGMPFACLKFRTMVNGADRHQYDLEAHNEASGALFKMRQDPRLTLVGRALRRFSLDELPQLVNVLRGQMSLVGPRPLPQRDFDRLEEWHMKRYLVMPGMTGLWQVSGRAELDFDDLVRLDFLYLERWSVFLDLAILVKTLPAVIWGRGAY
jgi:exopolysaccharide biosynthesis polyprenyl glycosylphosphotransferase